MLLSDKEIQCLVNDAKTKYNIVLIPQIENYDGCELQTIKVLYISFRDFNSPEGKKCYEELKSKPIFVKGPTCIDLLGYEEPFLNVDFIYTTYYQPHLQENKKKRSNSKFFIRRQLLKFANEYYFQHFKDTDFNFGLLWDDVLKYTSNCGQHITDEQLLILEQSVKYCLSQMKQYYLNSEKHSDMIQKLNE